MPTDPLASLRDIHLASGISSFWPPALGWWLLALLSLTLIAGFVYLITRHVKKNRYRKQALRELTVCYNEARNSEHLAAELSRILKRAAITQYGAKVVTFHSQEWLNFLSAQSPKTNTDDLSAICLGQYEPHIQTDMQVLYEAAAHWLKRHKSC